MPRKVLHRALNMLYPLECGSRDSEVDKPTHTISEADDGKIEDNEMDGEVSKELLSENSISRPTRKAMIAAREKIQKWMSPEDNDLVWGVLWITQEKIT